MTGGPNGEGWPFHRALTLADIYAQVGSIPGVAFLLDARIFVSSVENADTGQFGPETPVPTREGVRPGEQEILCTREHRIQLSPIWMVGRDVPQADRE